eukprot:scaffold17320_cov66-Phaeocystis_antarctica.AAC.1
MSAGRACSPVLVAKAFLAIAVAFMRRAAIRAVSPRFIPWMAALSPTTRLSSVSACHAAWSTASTAVEAATTACAAETAAAVSDDAARSLEALADAACLAASSLKLAPDR